MSDSVHNFLRQAVWINVHDWLFLERLQEWVINMPSMLDARVSLSLMDVVRGENQFDEEFEWVEADEVCPFLNSDCQSLLLCNVCL